MSAVLVAGHASDDLLRLAAPLGAVHHVELPQATSAELAGGLAALAAEIGADVVVLAAGRLHAEVAALLAHRTGAGLLLDAYALRREAGSLLGSKRVLGGTWEVLAAVTGPAVVLGKPAAGDGELPPVATAALPALAAGAAGTAVGSPTGSLTGAADVDIVSRTAGERTGVSLAEAAIVVAGGRGLEGDLTPVRDLADALGGAVGATRDIVEEHWIGHEAMVGQTGTMIAPRLYIGAGLSGAPHHMLGMRAAETIIAVNVDPDAPIMEAADLAILGDAGAVLTEAARLVRERRGTGA